MLYGALRLLPNKATGLTAMVLLLAHVAVLVVDSHTVTDYGSSTYGIVLVFGGDLGATRLL